MPRRGTRWSFNRAGRTGNNFYPSGGRNRSGRAQNACRAVGNRHLTICANIGPDDPLERRGHRRHLRRGHSSSDRGGLAIHRRLGRGDVDTIGLDLNT